jgi:hypothetical protein
VVVVGLVALSVLALSPGAQAGPPPPLPCATEPFTDVPSDHPFCAEIAWAAGEGITLGYGDGTFRPGATVTRQAMAAFLYRLAGSPAGPFPASGFTDVPVGHPFDDEIAWAAEAGITTGYGDGTFRPVAPVTRQSTAAFLYRLAGSPAGPFPASGFTDVPVGHPFDDEIAWLDDEGVAAGYPDGTFRPVAVMSRQAAAAFMFRYDQAFPPADGFVDPTWWAARQDDYLAFATTSVDAGSALNLIAHLERAERDPSYTFDATGIGPEAFDASWAKIDGYVDTADFDLLYLINLYLGYGDELGTALRERIETALLDFKYWYTDPTPGGFVDERWYWSENHRIIFHALEYLAGQAFPTETFTVTGMTGAEHQARAAAFIDEWLEEKADYGFSEWHSDVYYQKDVTPLLTLVEYADDAEIVERSAMILDLVLFDLATHTLDGNNGATHGRSYMKDKSMAPDQDVFHTVKLLFDATGEPYRSRGEPGAALLSRAENYRVPEVIRRAGTTTGPLIDRERMGVPIGLDGPLTSTPPEPYGISLDDPAMIPFWWERGALTAWPVVPLTLETIYEYDLWETEAFGQFLALKDIVGMDFEFGRALAHSLRDMINVGLLDEVNTYTYRTDDVMLSTAQDYRPGAHGNQYHAWQATLGARASVFTTHPANEPRAGDRWVDADLYWSGTGSMPRSAQQGTTGIHLYSPAYLNPVGNPLLESFSFLEYTHAWFPQENFDEVVTAGNWTFGRNGDGYVALWSWRPTEWRSHDPNVTFTNGLTEDFDLVAPGGPDNVWIVEVADAEQYASFDAFQDAIEATPPVVTELAPGGGIGPYGGFDVSWTSPSEGALTFGSLAPFTVDGTPVALDGYPRYDNPFTQTAFLADQVALAAGERELLLDFATWTRTAS